MPVPEFEWKTYRVPLRTAEGLVVDPAVTVDIDLPDLTRWPRPIEKAEVLLQTAAEVEHALLVQYLYAAFSLNTALTGDQLTAVTDWQQKLIFIARQEMGHLMTVQNLRLALRLPPTFERDDFPLGPKLYPFTLRLEPFTQASLAKYIVAESPLDEHLDDIPGFADALAGRTVNHVGTIYGLLAFVFSAGAAATTGSSIWNTVMQKVTDAATYQDGDPAAWHLPNDAIIENSTAMQGASDIWGRGAPQHITVWTITDRQRAIDAIEQVAAEGEGLVDGDDSHFTKFLAMFTGHDTLLPVPPAPPGGTWVPALPVPKDPQTSSIAEDRTRRWAELADMLYGMVLGEIEHHLRITDENDRRSTLAAWAISDMFGLEGLARILVTLPQGPGVACLPFTMPPSDLPLPDTEQARWTVHLSRVTSAIEQINGMRPDPDDAADAQLTFLLSSLGERRDTIIGALPTTSFARDIRPLFRPVDVDHMNAFGIDLSDYDSVKASAAEIADRIKRPAAAAGRMPPPPAAHLTTAQTDLFDKWVNEGSPP